MRTPEPSRDVVRCAPWGADPLLLLVNSSAKDSLQQACEVLARSEDRFCGSPTLTLHVHVCLLQNCTTGCRLCTRLLSRASEIVTGLLGQATACLTGAASMQNAWFQGLSFVCPVHGKRNPWRAHLSRHLTHCLSLFLLSGVLQICMFCTQHSVATRSGLLHGTPHGIALGRSMHHKCNPITPADMFTGSTTGWSMRLTSCRAYRC